jgi:hypothetical protein
VLSAPSIQRMLQSWTFLAFALAAFAGTGCRAQVANSATSAAEAFAPSEIRRLREFGAIGDGRSDDTAAIQRALSISNRFCLDGEGHAYRIVGTLRARNNLCLRNVELVQSLVPFDTSSYIIASCPRISDPFATVDCGNPEILHQDLARLKQSLSVRTLLIRATDPADTLRVTLENVKVNRGPHPEAGSRTDSAGIWLEGAKRADLRNVEITGHGKGYGLFVLRSDSVTVEGLWVHDLVWAPYSGERSLSRSQVEKAGWNSVSIQEFREAGRFGVTKPKFYGVRVQEQINCAAFAEVRNVTISNIRISRCMARFEFGDLPWQSDGLNISGRSSAVTIYAAAIDSTWEGIDVVANGGGIRNLSVSKLTVTNSFSFGVKLGYALTDARLSDIKIVNAGIAGVMIYGPVRAVTIAGATVEGVGSLLLPGGKTFAPWPEGARAGFRIDGESAAGSIARAPDGILIEDAIVNTGAVGSRYEFGILNTGGSRIDVRRMRARGFSKSAASGVELR